MKQILFSVLSLVAIVSIACSCASCKNASKTVAEPDTVALVGPTFRADSAYMFAAKQCEFGPRVMNSAAHDRCGEWIMQKFREFGMSVEAQDAELKGWDGTMLRSRNIIARFRPEQTTRILLCAHWDSRPWADNDPDSTNWRRPVMAANDGASGVAVMLELARALQSDTTLQIGVDFVCFDAEDWGVPQWSDAPDNGNSWALGAQHWAANPHKPNYTARFGILLDMVGGAGATFCREGMSVHYASQIVDKVWSAAHAVGYSSMFPNKDGGMVTDDHIPVNEKLGILTIDIIPHIESCPQSTFGPTWHTVNDTMDNIDANTLKAVGQTVIQVLFSE